MGIESLNSGEISRLSTHDVRAFDPDRRIDVNQPKDIASADSYNVDKRVDKTELPPTEELYCINDSTKVDALGQDAQISCQKEIDGKTYYYDDNGNLYRVDNELLPNSEYYINGYRYTTDEKSRIISAEGKLHLKDRDERLNIKDSIEDIGKGDQKPGDDRGHLIGDQFDGSNGLENMIPQNADINRNDFRNLETGLAKEVKSGNDVYYKVEPVYDGDSRRPIAIVVSYSINGNESTKIFINNPKE